MKSNEFLDEAAFTPKGIAGLQKFGSAVGGAIKGAFGGGGAMQGARAGWSGKRADIAQRDLINNVTSQALQKWQEYVTTARRAKRPVGPQDAVDWFTRYTGNKAEPDAGGLPDNIEDRVGMTKWIKREVAKYIDAKNQGLHDQPQQQDIDISGLTLEQLQALKAEIEQRLGGAA